MLIENESGEWSATGKEGTAEGLSAHGVSIASLARDVLSDPEATVREAALAGWVLHELEKLDDD